MEALALLCTLHADGPATLRRLRRAGCETLEALEAYEPDVLADLLRLSPAAARRFEREARMLGARLTTGILEREEAPENVRTAGVVGGGSYTGDTGTLARKDREILGKVLERWSHEGPAAQPQPLPEPEQEGEPDPEQAVDSAPAHVEPGRIEPGLLDGLDATRSDRLAQAGIGDLAALIEAAPLEIANTLGEGFAQVRRWQFLARRIDDQREAETVAPEALAPVATEAIEPAEANATPVREPQRPERQVEPAPVFAQAPAPAPRNTTAPPITVRKPWPVQAVVPDIPPSEPTTIPLTSPEPTGSPAPPRGWEPRKFWEAPAGATSDPVEPGGESNPSESAPGTTLNWNFEIPPPPPLPPLATLPDEVEQAGGPFA